MEKILKDSFDRKIDYLRLSVTDRCNLRCSYCMPEKGIQLAGRDELLTYEEILRIVGILAGLGIRKVRLTGGEPLIRDNILDLVSGLSRVDGIESLSMTTNGVLLEKNINKLKHAGLNGINISIDSLDPEKYRRITRGGDLERVIRAVRKALDMDFGSIKVNAVMGDFLETREIRRFIKWSMKEDIDIRFIEVMPVALLDEVECSSGGIKRNAKPETVSSAEKIFDVMKEFGEIEGVNDKKGHGPAVYYCIKGAKGSIGLISNQAESCCYCNRIRITPRGIVRLCLFSDIGLDLKKKIRRGTVEKEIKNDIIKFINIKPKDRNTGDIDCNPEDLSKIPDFMNRIGG